MTFKHRERYSNYSHLLYLFISVFIYALLLTGCSGTSGGVGVDHTDPDSTRSGSKPPPSSDTFNPPNIDTDYTNVADFSEHYKWGSYNVHDPSVIKVDDRYYMFSTDVAYGDNLDRIGIQVRRSKDLVHWHFMGWAFDNGIPPKLVSFMETHQPGYEKQSIWAPFIMKVGDTFRLYYSVPGNDGLKLAAIGLATSDKILGPWQDKGIVISTTKNDPINSIDPYVIVDQETGRYWMTYGSYYKGIYIVELDPETGKLLHPGDIGKRIAFREDFMDSIEGANILYNPNLDKYFLFVSYGWLEDTYNVRVGRSEHPQGPYYGYNGNKMSDIGNVFPRITAMYELDGGPGWQGFGHNTTIRVDGKYYYISQARPHFNKFLMNLHVHRMFWTPDGWPVISPERYADVPQKTIKAEDLEGEWEYIVLNSTSSLNKSIHIQLLSDGTIAGSTVSSTWTYDNNILKLNWNNGKTTIKAKVSNAWDWENRRRTIVFTGLNDEGISVWGKKIEQ